MDLDNLDAVNVEALQQFVTITDWPEDDIAGAVQMMEVCNWNVELALTRYFDSGPIRPNPNAPVREQTPPPVVAPRVVAPTPRTFSPPRTSFLASVISSIVLFPLTIISRAGQSLYSFFTILFPFLPRWTGVYPANLGAAHSERRSINPRDTAARFIRDFQEDVGYAGPLTAALSSSTSESTNSSEAGEITTTTSTTSTTATTIPGKDEILPFFDGGYTQALDYARRELRILVVLLQSDEHDDTHKFNKDVLCSPDVVQFFKQNDIIIWGGNVRESEAYQVSNALSCTKYPFLAVIAYTPASSSHPSAMSIHARLQGYVSPPSLIASINNIITRHGPTLTRIRLERQEQQSARDIRAQQDSAYEASLAADRERERIRQEQERAELDRLAALEYAERQRQQLAAQKDLYRIWRATQLKTVLPEFSSSSTSEPIARISIRLQNGERIRTQFLSESQSVEDIYAYVDCYLFLYPTDNLTDGLSDEAITALRQLDSGVAPLKPKNYHHSYMFNLVSPMPRQLMPVDSAKLIRDESSLFPNGNLIVEDIDDDEDDERSESSNS
ncbi:uncharacterized protein V1516DRAFT_711289 [Lipomyces oligophaga]|uniref:uncharacterized protein n=1 Tax=Lipomyces oligophaga TaxID=45792 RepID=UPI0034CE6220